MPSPIRSSPGRAARQPSMPADPRTQASPLTLAATLVLLFLVSLPLVTVRIYAADELQYYAQLRSLLKDGDLDCRDEYVRLLEARPWASEERRMLVEPSTETGVAPNFATIGAALLWAPFFLAGDAIARLGGWPADGYSMPYIAAVCYGSALYAFAGLLLLFDVARRETSARAAFAATLLAWWATALPFYMYVTPPMAHATSVFASALFVWLWYRWRQSGTLGSTVALGLAGGLMTLVREQNVMLLVLPAFDLVRGLVASRDGRRKAIVAGLVIGACFAAALVPQFLAWNELFGHFRPGEQRMSFFHPWPVHLADVLLSTNHGLVSWHPVWIAGVCGLVLISARKPSLGAPLLLGFAALTLFLSCVTNWAGGMAFGQRRMLDCLFVIVVGGAALVEAIPRRVAIVAGVVLVWWNLSLLLQFGSGMIAREGPVDWREVVHNQFVVVPRRALSIGGRYLSSPDAFTKKASLGDDTQPRMPPR